MKIMRKTYFLSPILGRFFSTLVSIRNNFSSGFKFLGILLLVLLVSGKSWGQYSGTGTFTKITSLSDLTDGYYVIAYGTTYAMNNTNTSSYFDRTAITPVSNVITNPATTIVWKIQTDGGGRTIYNENSSKYISYTGSSNTASAVSTVSANSERWTFALATSVFTCVNLTSNTRYLQYNTSSPRFACYTNTQQNLTLYKMASSNDQTSKAETPTTQISAGDVASTTTVSGSAIDVFKFKISDLGTADGLATKVTQVKVKKSSGTADWTDHIAGASIWDGANQISTGTVTITDAEITFPITSGNLDIANNSNKEISLKIWLKTSNIIDNSTMVFTVSQTTHGFTSDLTGSGFAPDFGAPVTSNTMTVKVEATKLLFTTSPSTTACPNTNLTVAPVVKATDANGNVDANFTGAVELANSGSISMTGYQISNATAGVATFTNLQFSTTGNVTLTASSSGLTDTAPSSSIAISVENVTSAAATNGNAQSVLTWTNPSSCYDEIIIVAKANSAVSLAPSGDGSAYTANLSFASGSDFDGGYVVYKGTTSSQTIIGLTNATTYYFTYFTRKGSIWSSGIFISATPAFESSTTDYYRSKATGNWNSTSTWESSTDGSTNWINATLTPTSTANTITILNGHTVTVNAAVSVDQVVVNTGGKIIVNSSQTLTIANGTDTYDMSVSGNVENSGTITATGAVKFESGGYYKHTGNGGSLVSASWDANSTCEITGLTSATSLSNFGGQVTSYGNLIWNCTGQTGWFNATGSFDVAGNFTINSTGGGARGINLVTSTVNRTFNITGNLEINGSKLTLTNASGIATLNIGGNLILNSSSLNQLDFGYSASSTTPSSGNYRSIMNLQGNFANGNSSILKITDGTYYGKMVFAKNGIQTYSNQNTTATMNGIDHIVNTGSTLELNSDIIFDDNNDLTINGTIDFSVYKVSGSNTNNTFTLSSNATCKIANANGLNYALGVGGTKTLDTGANYNYNGSSVQVTGSLLPLTVNNLNINNTSGLSLSNNLTANALDIASGSILNVPAAKQLTVSTTLTNNGTLNLLSDGSGTATILTPATISGIGTSKVYQNLSLYHSWYMSSPVIGEVKPMDNNNAEPALVKWYDETKGDPSGWTEAIDKKMSAGKGYLFNPGTTNGASTINFTGTLNNGNIPVDLTRSSVTKAGFNLIGNPYPSYFNVFNVFDTNSDGVINYNAVNGAVDIENNILPTYWYRTKSATTGWGWDTYNISGKVATNSNSGLAINSKIPPMQAFWVRVINATANAVDATFNFTNANRSHQDVSNNSFRAPADASTVNQILRLRVSNENIGDEAVIYFNTYAANGYDNYDSPKMMNGSTSTVPDIYTQAGAEQLVINGLKDIAYDTEIPLYFKANASTATSYTLVANEISNFEAGTVVYIKNNLTKQIQLISDGSAYAFEPSVVGSDPAFSLIIKAPGTVTDINGANSGKINIFANQQGQISVITPELIENGLISVYNAVGQKLLSRGITTNVTVLKETFVPGVYVVKVNNVSRKVIVK